MKKLLIVTLCIIGVIACIMGLTACSSETYYGTYYGGYPNDATSAKLVISRKYVTLSNVDYTYSLSGSTLTLSSGDQIRLAEENQVAYFPLLRVQFQGGIPVRNGYFSAQLTSFSNYQLTNTFQFNKDGTCRFVDVQSAEITSGTYNLKNGVLSVFNKSQSGGSGHINSDKLHFWYIDENYNIYVGATVKDYKKFQMTDSENPSGNGEKPDNENPLVYEPHTLTYNFNYGDAGTTTQQVTKNEKVNLISPSRDGYKFLGWYDGYDKVDSGIWQFDSDVTLNAWWEAIDYSITYNTDNGTMPDNYLKSFTVSSYDLPYSLPVPIKQGFNFVGWYENEDFSGEPITTIQKSDLRNYVLYAKYTDEELLEYELSFDETYYSVVGFKGNPQYVTVPETKDGLPVKEIEAMAFKACSTLTSIILPDSIYKIGNSAFFGCSSLSSVYYTGDIESWCNISFSNYAANPLYYAHNLYIDDELVTELVIPDTITKINSYAFYGCTNITSVIIPDSVTTISSCAFSGCSSLTNINTPNSVTSIGEAAFSNCSSLTSITIPDGVTSIERAAFSGCSSLTSVIMGNSITTIDYSAFAGCSSLTSITIPDSVTDIYSDAFPDKFYKRYNGCYYLPTKSSDYGYLYKVIATDITNVKIHNDCKAINHSAFSDCSSLTSVTIPDSVTSIGYYAFSDCSSLTSVTIPDSVTSIGYYAFSGCSSLTSVTIGNNVTTIGSHAFSNCYGLKSVYYTGNIAGWCNISFNDNSWPYSANPLYYAHNLYVDNELVTELVIPDTVTEIKACAFYGCTNITSVVIPDSVMSIGERAFYDCSNLSSMFYKGDAESWRNMTIDYGAIVGRIYYFSATEPADYGYYWHYDTNGKTPVVWQKQY